MRNAALVFLLLLLGACASRPLEKPAGARKSVIAMRVFVDAPARGSYAARQQPAEGIVLVRLDDKGDPTHVNATIESNYSKGATQYLFNAEPGRYAVVACFRRRDGRKVRSYFSDALIKKTIVDVKPRSAAYVGTLRIRVTFNTATADDAQDHYFRLLDPEFHTLGVLERMIARTDNELEFRHKLEQGKDAEARFHERARSLFAGSSWLSRLPD